MSATPPSDLHNLDIATVSEATDPPATVLPAKPPVASITASAPATTPAKRGRKPKGEKKMEDGRDVRWNLSMVESLMTAKFQIYRNCFEHTSNNKKKSEGWSKVALAINKQYNLVLSVQQVKTKYHSLNKKYRDNSAYGKESRKTGNNPIDANNCRDDKYILVAPYFAKQPGCGADLGQSTDKFERQDSSAISTLDVEEDDFTTDIEVTESICSNKKPCSSPVNATSICGDHIESSIDKMAGSITALSNAIIQSNLFGNETTATSTNTLQAMMQKVVDSTTQMQESMLMTAKLQAAMLEKLEKLTDNK